MNEICLSEHSEYEGQYETDISGAYVDCNCTSCRDLRTIYNGKKLNNSIVMNRYKLGDKAYFNEHFVLVKDLDSLDEEPVLVSLIAGCEDVEKKAEKLATEKAVIAISGNTLEGEYQCETGRVIECELVPVKLGWKAGKEIHPQKEGFSIQDYYKHG